MQKNDMNLLERYNDLHKERSNQFSLGRIYIIILAAIFLIMGALSIQLWLTESGLKSDVATLSEYNNNPQIKTKMAEIATLKENIKSLDQILVEAKSINTVFSSAVRFDSFTMNVLSSSLLPGTGFNVISYKSGIISVDFYGTRASDVSNYALRLKNQYYFKSVVNSGYNYDQGANKYFATILCIMKGGN
jgi:hypothetical protein